MSDRRRHRVDGSRRAALEVLTAVRTEDAYANLVLPRVLRVHGLTGRDAAFATELASGTLRLQGLYDAVIDACLDRPRLQPEVRDVLRLGAHQLLSMRVPDHAAISTSVDLVRASVGRGPSGLVNAVLRKVARRTREEWVAAVAPGVDTDPVGHFAVAHSHPRWVVEELAAALRQPGAGPSEDAVVRVDGPSEHDELGRLLASDNEAPRVTLVARPGLATVEELTAAGGQRADRSPYAVVLPGGDPAEVPAVVEGRAGVQDEGSQLVALAVVEAELGGRDERWLDLCSGPGGKTALLGAVAAQRGAHVVANERQPHRAELVRRAVRALSSGTVHVVTGDGTAPAWRPATFDRVLVDAPCSGLGALRRRPEARWRRSSSDLPALVTLQRALLETAIESVRPGGVVVYATCSPVLAETRGVVDAVTGVREDVVEESSWQLWPHRDGTDAMFAATLRRRAP